MIRKFLVAICVNYNNDEETIQFADDLHRQAQNDIIQIIVVDNSESASHSGILAKSIEALEFAELYIPGENLGFYPGAAWALTRFLQSNEIPEWVMVSNTDMRILGRDLVVKLRSLFGKHAPAVVAPRIISILTNNDQNPQIVSRPSRARWFSYLILYRYYPLYLAYHFAGLVKNWLIGLSRKLHDVDKQTEISAAREIYAPHGSCVLFNCSYFEAGANLDHGVFLYGETISVAEMVRERNLSVVYEPRIRFEHKEHSTTGRLKPPRTARQQLAAAQYCWDKYFKDRN